MKTIEQWAEFLGLNKLDPEVTYEDLRAIQRDAFDAGARAVLDALDVAAAVAGRRAIIEQLPGRP